MTAQTVRKSHPRFPRGLMSVALTVALGATAALAFTRPWESGRPAVDATVGATMPELSQAERLHLELLQHEALTEAVFGAVLREPASAAALADALAQHEALTDAVFGSLSVSP